MSAAVNLTSGMHSHAGAWERDDGMHSHAGAWERDDLSNFWGRFSVGARYTIRVVACEEIVRGSSLALSMFFVNRH
jgi:hypothetical protein